MRRSAARRRMVSRSPGRRRIVIRSRAGPLLDGMGIKSANCESSNARMAISASADSDICRCAATAANKRFSCDVGRAVIEGTVDCKAPSFTAPNLELQQNADTSLSCHHSNNNPITLLDPKSLLLRSTTLDLHIARMKASFVFEFHCFFQRNSLRQRGILPVRQQRIRRLPGQLRTIRWRKCPPETGHSLSCRLFRGYRSSLHRAMGPKGYRGIYKSGAGFG